MVLVSWQHWPAYIMYHVVAMYVAYGRSAKQENTHKSIDGDDTRTPFKLQYCVTKTSSLQLLRDTSHAFSTLVLLCTLARLVVLSDLMIL